MPSPRRRRRPPLIMYGNGIGPFTRRGGEPAPRISHRRPRRGTPRSRGLERLAESLPHPRATRRRIRVRMDRVVDPERLNRRLGNCGPSRIPANQRHPLEARVVAHADRSPLPLGILRPPTPHRMDRRPRSPVTTAPARRRTGILQGRRAGCNRLSSRRNVISVFKEHKEFIVSLHTALGLAAAFFGEVEP